MFPQQFKAMSPIVGERIGVKLIHYVYSLSDESLRRKPIADWITQNYAMNNIPTPLQSFKDNNNVPSGLFLFGF